MKKKTISKLLAVTLSVAMAMSMAACGSGSNDTPSSDNVSAESSAAASSEEAESDAPEESVEEETPEVDMSPLSITISLPSDEQHTEADPFYDQLVSDLNDYLQMDITWQWEASDTYYDSLDLAIVAADVADVMVVGKTSTFLQAFEEGLFWDLTDYIGDYDNLATISEAVLANCSYNGAVFGLPRSRTLARNGMGYRLDWLENLGLDAPETWDQFVDMLEAFTYNDPDGNGVDDTVGLYLDEWDGVWDIIFCWFGVPNEWGIDENGDLVYKYMTDEYKTAAAAIRDLYSRGLINSGANGITSYLEESAGSVRNNGLRTGIGGAGVQVLDDLRKVQTYFVEQGITTDDEVLFTLQGYVDTGLGPFCLPTTGTNNYIAISTKNVTTEAQLRRVLQMLNDLCDGECINLIEYGWEGKSYDLDENGYVVLYDADQLAAAGATNTKYNNGFNQVIAYFTAEENARPVVTEAGTTPITALENQLYEEDIPYCVTNYGASYTSATYTEIGSTIAATFMEALDNYIQGTIDDTAFEEAINTWWNSGGETITAEMNELYHAAGN